MFKESFLGITSPIQEMKRLEGNATFAIYCPVPEDKKTFKMRVICLSFFFSKVLMNKIKM